jgi:hypothetical protein
MKQRIELEKAAAAEAFGGLAMSAGHKHRSAGTAVGAFTQAQGCALSELVHSLVQVAREAGAEQRPVTIGGVALELREDGVEDILSIRTTTISH